MTYDNRKIFSLVRSMRGHRASVVVAMARRSVELTTTELPSAPRIMLMSCCCFSVRPLRCSSLSRYL